MKWTELLRKDNYALLQSESDTQYAVVSGYDPTQPEDQQWSYGTYFCYWKDESEKASCLSSALDAFKAKSYADYIPNVKRTEPKRYVFVNWYGEQLGHEDVDDLEEATDPYGAVTIDNDKPIFANHKKNPEYKRMLLMEGV